VAVFAFYFDRYDISEDMERESNRHRFTPFRELWLTAAVIERYPLLLFIILPSTETVKFSIPNLFSYTPPPDLYYNIADYFSPEARL